MTKRSLLTRPYASDARPLRQVGSDAECSIRRASVLAGTALLLVAGLVSFGNLVVVNRLVTDGDAARTASDIAASSGLFRLGIVSLFLVVALDVVIAWALYQVFSPVSRTVSLVAAWFRLVYASVFLVAISELVGVLRLLRNDEFLSAFTADQLHAHILMRVDAFHDVWGAGVFLFGTHVLILSWLAYRSGFVPKLVALLLAIAGAGYVVDSVGAVLYQGSWIYVAPLTFVGEIVFALWLVIKGPRAILNEPAKSGSAVAARSAGPHIDLRDTASHVGTHQRPS